MIFIPFLLIINTKKWGINFRCSVLKVFFFNFEKQQVFSGQELFRFAAARCCFQNRRILAGKLKNDITVRRISLCVKQRRV